MLTDKRHLLDEAGYSYKFDREIYFDRKSRKAFSIEFVEDHDVQELRRLIGEERPKDRWNFYFNSPPSGTVRRELEKALS